MAARFLSEEWALNATAAFQADEGLADALSGIDMLIQFTVNEVEDSARVDYCLSVENSGAELALGRADNPDITLESDYPTAVAVSKGEENIQTAYFTGKISVSGNLAKLVRYRAAVTRLAELVSGLDVDY